MTTSSEEEAKAARAVFARHRRRTREARCAFCGGPWRRPGSRVPVAGCAARQYAGEALAAVGQLDNNGHPTRPADVEASTLSREAS